MVDPFHALKKLLVQGFVFYFLFLMCNFNLIFWVGYREGLVISDGDTRKPSAGSQKKNPCICPLSPVVSVFLS